MAAMTAMYMIKLRKVRSTVAKLGCIPAKAPSFSTNSNNNQLTGTVNVNTKVTAIPRPRAVLTFFETAKNEHMPRK